MCTGGVAVPRRPRHADLTPVAGLDQVTSVAVAHHGHAACALDSAGVVSCWGTLDREHQLETPTPIESLSPAKEVVGSFDAFCALVDEDVWCWGENLRGIAAPASSATYIAEPVRVEGLPAITKIGGAFVQVCALARDASVWCWGEVAGKVERSPRRMHEHDVVRFVETTATPGQGVCVTRRDKTQACIDRRGRFEPISE
jgi:hypothetical protein